MTDQQIRKNVGASSSRRKVLIGGLLFVGAGGTALLKPRAATLASPPGTLDRLLPHAFAVYQTTGVNSLILPPTSSLREETYNDVLSRGYNSPSGRIYLMAASGAANEAGLTIHRAEDCYSAFGFSVSPSRRVGLGAAMPAGAEGCFFTARRGDRVEHVLYWVRIGNTFPTSPWAQRIALAKANLEGSLPSGVLFRLSIFGSNASSALMIMKDFNARLFAAVSATAREALLGQQ